MKELVGKLKDKFWDLKERFKRTLKDAWSYCCTHTSEIVSGTIAIGAIIGAALKVVTSLATIGNSFRKDDSDREYYDHSMGQTIRLKRKLTNSEKIEVRERASMGETYYDIYKSMNLLKR